MKDKIVYIYESPDNGKTIYRRPFGKDQPREKIKPSEWNGRSYLLHRFCGCILPTFSWVRKRHI